ncbi:MAG: carbohydrate binding family 9 domain-containing protein [Acidobacteriota bacterium]|nr:carbohydrate binding family 9 domain-containing protein [Acidobacteriota bacterium]MDH3784959.1 carbohydrate binding family 9 domain-containing protein [Acidobacteriota bacterium]
MRRSRYRLFSGLFLHVLFAGLLHAAPGDEAPSRVDIQRVSRAPQLEEFVDMRPPADLADELTRISGFVQREPEDGQPASQKTDVYLGYDDDWLHVVFVAFDDQPDTLRSHYSKREDIRGDETVEIQLDTYADQRRAYSFLCNPFGVQWDAIWTEGQMFDVAWDTIWESEGRLTDRGYLVRMAIPFKSLRFSPDDAQTWGIVLVRDIPRNNEVSFWPRVTSRIDGRLNQEALLSGLEGISPGRNMWLIPYATARSFRLLDEDTLASPVRDSFDGDIGLDAKFVLRESLALDLTMNPDFAQIESDQPQITSNQRFEVQFPERRPFFIENATFFTTPLNLLFTRQIEDPSLGARLTGKIGKYSMGVIVANDQAPGKRAVAGDPLVGEDALATTLRLSRDLSQQSSIGVLYTDRRLADAHNRVFSLDGRIKLDENWVASLQAVYSRDEDLDGNLRQDQAYSFAFDRQGRKWKQHIHYREVGPDFITELGFTPRVDVRNLHTSVDYRFRPEGPRLIAWGPGGIILQIEDAQGERIEWRFVPQLKFEFRRQTQLELSWFNGYDTLRPVDYPNLTASQDFRVSQITTEFESRFSRLLYIKLNVSDGERINFVPPVGSAPFAAHELRGRVEFTLRPGRRLSLANVWLFNQLDERLTNRSIFRNNIYRSRLNVQFTRELSLRLILQLDETKADATLTSLETRRRFNGDLLMTYLINPWTAFYVGYNSNYLDPAIIEDVNGNPLVRTERDYVNDSRAVFFKVSYLFRP